ncbi:MAG TPA: hypothetical protein VI391_02685 [Thermoanaerobaculia bacterium]
MEQTTLERTQARTELPRYEAPRIQVLSEKDILSTFQITQSMNTWWTMGMTCPCVTP